MSTLPPDVEQQRLASLRALCQLDTDEDTAFDDLTRMAADCAQVPIALVSLVDAHRQWFKARVGLAARETPREWSFCAHAIASPAQTLVVEDAQADPRFARNPLVTGEPGIRFYAGVPLVTQSGAAVGTLCVIDRQPRTMAPDQLERLRFLAGQVIAMMEARQRKLAALDDGAGAG